MLGVVAVAHCTRNRVGNQSAEVTSDPEEAKVTDCGMHLAA